MNGGYDDGYKKCECFWGRSPGSLLVRLIDLVPNLQDLSVLDVGCGEGKNAAFLAQHGAFVRAVDVSPYAIDHAQKTWRGMTGITWELGDAMSVEMGDESFDIVIAYGILHCLGTPGEVATLIRRLQHATRSGGWLIVCAFNARHQDLRAHPDFHPCLLDHTNYLDFFRGWAVEYASDSDLHETHPHNQIPHTHSMTRILARKIS